MASAGAGDNVDPSRIPPGQYYERGFPVLSAGPTPRTPLEKWTFSIRSTVDESHSWTWDEFTALPAEDVTVDIHCITKWSKLNTRWKGIIARPPLAGSPHTPLTPPAGPTCPFASANTDSVCASDPRWSSVSRSRDGSAAKPGC